MFAKNLFKIEQDKMTKIVSKKIEELIGSKELVYVDFKDKFYLPKIYKNIEIIHAESNKVSNMLRYVRDKPNIFMDYLLKDNIKLNDEQVAAAKQYFSNKTVSKTLKNLTKLELSEIKNNLKTISCRIKKSFIVHEKTDTFIKNLDIEETVFIVSSKNFESLDFLNKCKNANQLVIKNCTKNLKNFFKENNFKEIHKSVFYK
jgi:hypothetical protein